MSDLALLILIALLGLPVTAAAACVLFAGGALVTALGLALIIAAAEAVGVMIGRGIVAVARPREIAR